jgi:hypothetical protein
MLGLRLRPRRLPPPCGLGAQIGRLHQHRAQVSLRQLTCHGAPGKAAADDDDIGSRAGGYCGGLSQ